MKGDDHSSHVHKYQAHTQCSYENVEERSIAQNTLTNRFAAFIARLFLTKEGQEGQDRTAHAYFVGQGKGSILFRWIHCV